MHHRSHPAPAVRRIIIITFAFVILAGSLLLGRAFLAPHAASAAACSQASGCSGPATTCLPRPGPQCTEQDPAAQGCVDPSRYGIASTEMWVGGNMVGRIDERYAPNCQSWWVRAFLYNGKGLQFSPADPIQLLQGGTDYVTLDTLSHDTGYSEVYSAMSYAPNNPPENYTIQIWLQLDNGTFIHSDLKANPVP